MSNTISPNMGLVIPGVGTESSPDWATDLNASLSSIDSHNHSSGQGVQITPNGMNINADLAFQNNNATSLRAARFYPQVSPIANAGSDVGQLYVSGNELYYNDVTGGHQVQITNVGSVNAGAGSISGLPSGTASASYNAGTFTWQSATATPASMDFGSAVLRNLTANSKGLTLSPPGAMASDYSITLPALGASTLPIVMDTSGNMTASQITYAQCATAVQNMLNKAPTIQTFTSGTGTYTTPAGVTYLKIRMVGGGGGGAGSSTAGNGGVGGTGGTTTFGSSFLTAVGGSGGNNAGNGGVGGSASLASPAIGMTFSGGTGQGCAGLGISGSGGGTGNGGSGSSSPFGGGGGGGYGFGESGAGNSGSSTGNAAATNTGSGGGGAGISVTSVNATSGGGGGGGGYIDVIVPTPSASYSYAVGAAGSAGTAGSNGKVGGAGGSGFIIVEEHYGS